MDSRPNSLRRASGGSAALVAATATLASSAMWFGGTGLAPVWWLIWLAPLPILLVSTRTSGWRAFWLAAISWSLGCVNMWHYLVKAIELPLALVVLSALVPALLYAVTVLQFRRFALRGAWWKAAFVFPTLWVSLEYLNNVTSPHATFGNLGYSQMDFLPVLQITSLTGIWGISFCMFLFASTLAIVIGTAGDFRTKKRLATVVGLFLAAVLGYGYWRLHSTPASERAIRVGLMATGAASPYPQHDDDAVELLRAYSAKASDMAKLGTQIIVMPEKIAVVSDQATSDVDTLYAGTALRANAHIVVGIDRGTATKRWNEVRMYSPDGTLEATYDKHHMVPRFEDVDQMGTKITTLDQASGRWGVQICKDMDFPALSRQYGREGVGLLLVPAWDFTLDGWLHGRMAIMRGVESGFTIARSAKQGLLTVSDNRGRVLAQQDAASVRFASLVTTLPVRHDDTLYARWGDWFAWLNVAGFFAVVISKTRQLAPENR